MSESTAGPAGISGRASTVPLSGRVCVIAAAAYACVLLIGVVLGRTQPAQLPVPVTGAAAVVAAVVGTALVTVRLSAAAMLALAAVATACIAVVGDTRSANVCWFAIVLISGLLALVGGQGPGVVYWAAVTVLFIAEWAVRPDPGWGAWIGGSTMVLLAGLLLRRQFDLLERLRAAQAELAASARAQERNRIARDLHDVIAHTLTVSLLHVMSARLAVEHEPAEVALNALAEAERLGRESLAEVRQVVGMLRTGGEVDGQQLTPLPGVDGLEPLVSRFQAAGASVTYKAEGDATRVPATVGLALHRILQEALTNVIKHAAGSAVSVRLVVASGEVTLTVDSGSGGGGYGYGGGGDGGYGGGGHGIIGMRERAQSLGGTCTAGPAGRGWLVRARFPLGSGTEGG